MRSASFPAIPTVTLAALLGAWSAAAAAAGGSPTIRPTLRGPYLGQPAPGDTARVFAPGVVSLPETGDYACTWSADGNELYFTRSVEDSSGIRQAIMTCRATRAGWTVPAPVDFSAAHNAHEPHLTADGRHIYWGWFRPTPAGEPPTPFAYGIYAADRGPGGWSAARYVGHGMFVSSTREGDLYMTEHVLEGGALTGYLVRATLRDGRIAARERIGGALDSLRPRYRNLAHPGIAPDGSYLVFDVEGGRHLFVAFRRPDGAWSAPVDLTEHGFERGDGVASVSPDGRYLFFGRDGDLYWMSTAPIRALRPRP